MAMITFFDVRRASGGNFWVVFQGAKTHKRIPKPRKKAPKPEKTLGTPMIRMPFEDLAGEKVPIVLFRH